MEPYLHSLLSVVVHRINNTNDQSIVLSLSGSLGRMVELIANGDKFKAEENMFMAIRVIFDNLYSSHRMMTHFGLASGLTKVIQIMPIDVLHMYLEFLNDRIIRLLK